MIRAAVIYWRAIRLRYLQAVLRNIPVWHPEYVQTYWEVIDAEARLAQAWEA